MYTYNANKTKKKQQLPKRTKAKKPPLKKVHTSISFVTFPLGVIISIGETDKEFIDNLVEQDGLLITSDIAEYLQDVDPISAANTFHTNGGHTIIKINTCLETAEDYGYLHHEIFHAVDMVTRRIGIELVEQSCEAYAYMHQHLTNEIYKLLGVHSDGTN